MWQATENEPLELTGQAVLVVGCGAVGSALGRAFQQLGARLQLWSRSEQSARSLAAELGAQAVSDLNVALQEASLVCIAVSDDALAGLVAELGHGASSEGFIFHTNGSAGHQALQPLAVLGWRCAKLHPLRAFPQAGAGAEVNLQDTWFATAAEPEDALLCSALVRSLGGNELRLRPGGSLALHAAASLLSGGLVALFDQALKVCQEATQDPNGARAALEVLLRSTVSNLEKGSPADALSGPIARGALQLVAQQLEALDGDARELYRLLGRRMLALSDEREPMDPERLEKMRALLD